MTVADICNTLSKSNTWLHALNWMLTTFVRVWENLERLRYKQHLMGKKIRKTYNPGIQLQPCCKLWHSKEQRARCFTRTCSGLYWETRVEQQIWPQLVTFGFFNREISKLLDLGILLFFTKACWKYCPNNQNFGSQTWRLTLFWHQACSLGQEYGRFTALDMERAEMQKRKLKRPKIVLDLFLLTLLSNSWAEKTALVCSCPPLDCRNLPQAAPLN